MSFELVYTSVPKGLGPHSSGFCTAAATAGISRVAMTKLEGLSAYEFHFQLSDANAADNPVNFAHTVVPLGAQPQSVLSRVGFSGADYSGRANKIAHHFLLSPADRSPGGPAAMMLAMRQGVFRDQWSEPPAELPSRTLSDLPITDVSGPANTWQGATGDAGWAGELARAAVETPTVPAYLIYQPGTDILPLLAEALAVLDPPRRWNVTFAAYYTSMPAGCFYNWRAVVAGSAAAREALRFPNATVINLTEPCGPAPDNEYTAAARAGTTVAPPAPVVQAEPASRAPARRAVMAESVESGPPAAPGDAPFVDIPMASPDEPVDVPAIHELAAGIERRTQRRQAAAVRRPWMAIVIALVTLLIVLALVGLGIVITRTDEPPIDPAPETNAPAEPTHPSDGPTEPVDPTAEEFERLAGQIADILDADAPDLAAAESLVAEARQVATTPNRSRRLDNLESRLQGLKHAEEVLEELQELRQLAEGLPPEDSESYDEVITAADEVIAKAEEVLTFLGDSAAEDQIAEVQKILTEAQSRRDDAQEAKEQAERLAAMPEVIEEDRRGDSAFAETITALARSRALTQPPAVDVGDGTYAFDVGGAHAFVLRTPPGIDGRLEWEFDDESKSLSIYQMTGPALSRRRTQTPTLIARIERGLAGNRLIVEPTDDADGHPIPWPFLVIEVAVVNAEGVIENLAQCRVHPIGEETMTLGYTDLGVQITAGSADHAVELINAYPRELRGSLTLFVGPGWSGGGAARALADTPSATYRTQTRQIDPLEFVLSIDMDAASGQCRAITLACETLAGLHAQARKAALYGRHIALTKVAEGLQPAANSGPIVALQAVAERADAAARANQRKELAKIKTRLEAYAAIAPNPAGASALLGKVRSALGALDSNEPPSSSALLNLCIDLKAEVSFIHERANALISGVPAADLIQPGNVIRLFKQVAMACDGVGPIQVRDAWGVPLMDLGAQWGREIDRDGIDVIGELES